MVLYSDTDANKSYPIILDLGTGLTVFAGQQPLDGSFRGVAFLSHLHFDHIQGLPFFAPVDRAGAQLVIYGPSENGISLAESMGVLIGSPYFPVMLSDLSGEIVIGTIDENGIDLDQPGHPKVFPCLVDHTNATFGYRIEIDGKVIVYIPDHQAPSDNRRTKDSVLELCQSADILIHDAQYTNEEFGEKAHWGHSTYDFAMWIASRAMVKLLVFFHHDPRRSDHELEAIELHYQELAGPSGLRVLAAREGEALQI
ncbi:MAG: hypothetical protein HKL84_08230 [Acidimicrobiaceae bacterium]|nr:hypothetical protein [Acidimicrobiaceae bacterium]